MLGAMVADRPQWSDAELVRAAASDDPEAFGALFDRWFDRVYDVARNIVRNDDTAAEVAQDVFLTSWQRLGQLDDPERFGGWLLRTSRNRALNRLEKERRAQPLDGDVMTGLHESQHGVGGDRDDLVGSNRLLETEAISDARDQQSLVWDAAAALGARDVSLLDLQLRHQLSPAEIADELGVTANNAHQLLFRLRNKLGDAIANHQVWRNGAPRCEELAALVDGDPFDPSTNKIVQRHAGRCETCGPERERVVDPAKLFAAVPIAIAPPFVREQAAAALAADGVPVESGAHSESPEADGPGDGSSETHDPGTGASDADAPHDDAPHDEAPSDGASDAGAPPSAAPSAPQIATSRAPVPAAAVGAAPSTIAPSNDGRSTMRRRLALAGVAAIVLIGLVVALDRPAGDVDLATGPTSSDAAGDSAAEDDELANPSTTGTTQPSTTTPTTAPTTEAPTTEPPTTRTPTTEPPTTESQPDPTPPPEPETGEVTSPPTDPPSTPPPPPPVIVRFSLSTPGGAIFCPNSTDLARTARWFTEETTSVTVTTPNGTTGGGFEGSHTFCAPTGSVITLTATGPGGTVSESETLS